MADDVIVRAKLTTYNNDNSDNNDKNKNNRSRDYKGRKEQEKQQEMRKVEEEYNRGNGIEDNINDPVEQLAIWKERRESCREPKLVWEKQCIAWSDIIDEKVKQMEQLEKMEILE